MSYNSFSASHMLGENKLVFWYLGSGKPLYPGLIFAGKDKAYPGGGSTYEV
jgi:hypothetical protein